MVYLILSGSLFKIGKSNNPKKRLSQIQTSSPFESYLIGIIECDNDFEIEKKLHCEYKNKRIKGEWFALVKKDVVDICDKYSMQKINNSYFENNNEFDKNNISLLNIFDSKVKEFDEHLESMELVYKERIAHEEDKLKIKYEEKLKKLNSNLSKSLSLMFLDMLKDNNLRIDIDDFCSHYFNQ